MYNICRNMKLGVIDLKIHKFEVSLIQKIQSFNLIKYTRV